MQIVTNFDPFETDQNLKVSIIHWIDLNSWKPGEIKWGGSLSSYLFRLIYYVSE